MQKNSSFLSRRNILLGTLQATGLLFLSGCENVFNHLHRNKTVLSVLESVEGANLRLLRLVTPRNKLSRSSARTTSRAFSSPTAILPPSLWNT